jgi:hypothetical protein
MNCVGVCTEGAATLREHKKGYQVRQMARHVNFIYSIIQWEVSISRGLETKLHSVLQKATNVVNVVKARPLNSRLFAVLCEETRADYKSLLLHSDVRSVSKGEVLKRSSELKKQVRRFLQDSGSPLHRIFYEWLSLPSCLWDIRSDPKVSIHFREFINLFCLFQPNQEICSTLKRE